MKVRQSHPLLLNSNILKPFTSINLINNFPYSFNFSPPRIPRSPLRTKSLCLKHERSSESSDGFCAISKDVPFVSDNLWSNFCLYLFSVHVPMSFGGISVVAHILNRSVLDPQTEALSLLTIQTSELIIVLSLLKYTAKPELEVYSFLKSDKFSAQRNWLLTSAKGFVLLILLIYLTSVVEDAVFGSKGVNDPILKEMLQSGDLSRTACILAYCIIIPVLEETVYRGYLLSTLASKTKWQYAVLISSLVFSFAHFSIYNASQLFVIGCILGSSYCCTGNLRTSILIHSMYNAVSLIITLFT